MRRLLFRRINGCRVRPSHVLAAVGLIVFTAGDRLAAAAEPKAGDPLTVTVQGKGGRCTITFRYCPRGKIRPGRPKPEEPGDARAGGNAPTAALDDSVRISPFFLSETEITIPQFRGLLGEARFEQVVKRFANLRDSFELKERADSGKAFPISMICLEDIADFCEALRTADVANSGGDPDGIVAHQFRIPTHSEWQYACRALAEVAAERTLPHFYGWPEAVDALDRNTREKCRSAWKKLGREDREEFRGTQEQIAFMLENSPTGDTDPLEIVSAFLKAGIGTSRQYLNPENGKVSVTGSTTKPNAWGLCDMHENVGEWVVVTGPEKAASLLRGIASPSSLSASDRQEKVFLLAGGSYNAYMSGSSTAWMSFTIWGGKPSGKTGAPEAFSLGEASAMTSNFNPGFRVSMHRTLSDSWLLALRRDAVLSAAAAPDTLGRLKATRAAALDVAHPTQTREVEARTAFYEGLAQYRIGRRADSLASIRAARKALPRPRGDAASRLASAFGGLNSPSASPAPKPVVEEEVFLDTLAALIEEDQ